MGRVTTVKRLFRRTRDYGRQRAPLARLPYLPSRARGGAASRLLQFCSFARRLRHRSRVQRQRPASVNNAICHRPGQLPEIVPGPPTDLTGSRYSRQRSRDRHRQEALGTATSCGARADVKEISLLFLCRRTWPPTFPDAFITRRLDRHQRLRWTCIFHAVSLADSVAVNHRLLMITSPTAQRQ